jgi:hypothetical protein
LARFYGTVEGVRANDTFSTTASRQGAAGIWAHIRGWDTGIEVRGHINTDTGEDEFEVWTTGGSHNGGNKRMIGTLTSKGFLYTPPPSR